MRRNSPYEEYGQVKAEYTDYLKGKPVPSTWLNNVNNIIHAIETIRTYEEVLS